MEWLGTIIVILIAGLPVWFLLVAAGSDLWHHGKGGLDPSPSRRKAGRPFRPD